MKKIRILLIALLILIISGLIFGNVYAADITRSLGAQTERPFTSSTYKYNGGDSLYYTVVKIFDNDDKISEELAYTKALYCLRGGIGFGAHGEDISIDPVEYTELGEMHSNTDRINIINAMNEYKTGENGANINFDREENIEVEINGETVKGTVNIYNAILWVLDESYLPKDITNLEGQIVYDASEYKNELLDKVGIVKEEQDAITDDDIEVLQQLAIWYFSNYDEQKAKIVPTVSQATMYPTQGLKINDSNDIGEREENLNKIYQYFIKGAIENSNKYKTDSETGNLNIIKTNKFDKTNNLKITSNDNMGLYNYYEIGPIKIEGIDSKRETIDAPETIDASDIKLYDATGKEITAFFEIAENQRHTVYKFVKEDGTEVKDNKLIKGMNYYIRFYKAFEKGSTLLEIDENNQYDMSSVTLKMSSEYYNNTATFLTAGNITQPVVEIEKEKIYSEDEITVEKEPPISISGTKTWVDYNNADNTRPESITIILLRNRNEIARKTITADDNWEYTFDNLEKYDENGKEYVYEIQEVPVEGYETEIDGYNIINRYETITSISGTKTWVDYDNIYGTRPETITIHLFRDGEEIDSKTISANDNWEYTFDNLEKYDETGREYVYTITEDPVEGYTTEIDKYDITNTSKTFDLALRKFITSIKRNGEEVEFDDRTPKINTETLINGTFNRDGKLEHTATYEHSKEPLTVKKGDIITYTLRIYNEGDLDGYATEITDYIPEGLAYINYYNTNVDNLWKLSNELDADQTMNLVGENGFYKTEEDVKNFELDDFTGITSLEEVQLVTGEIKLTTNELNDKLIKAFDKNKTEEEEGWQKAETGDGGLYYKDVQISCLVVAENTYKDTITNIAEISEDKDENGNDIIDRDSTPNNKQDPYDKQQEDDDDYEPVILKYFDLALRKFITGVETNGTTEDVTSRIPVPTMGEEGNIIYEHSKDPVYVANNDVVIYTIRVYNEGTVEGYAEEIKDDIPEGLEFLPNHNINKEYEWVMVDENGNITENVEEAVDIVTDYLSEAKENRQVITNEETGETTETVERDNLIKPFDPSKPISTENPLNPDYKDVKVAFKVTEPNTSDRIIVNSAQISEDSDDDEDSVPDEWNDGEDDQDKEYIYVKYFDLSLLKWVTQTVVTVDGKTTTTETGFEPNTGKTETTGIRDNKENEPVAKVELDKNKLNKTTVKFVYKIRVTNEGEIEGYATEITDYIPEGLEFLAEDNKEYGWVKEGEDKVTTRALETVLLKPGESAELEIVFTWKNDPDNLGLKTNIAEISEDYNDHNSKDIDSTPDNKQDPYETEQEDDDDFALVILSLKTGIGMGTAYTLLTTIVVAILGIGIYLIKKYVLDI